MTGVAWGTAVTGEVRVRQTRGTLADGREILYYDGPGAAPRNATDRRLPAPRPQAGELRFDALTGDWVAVAGHRADGTFLPPRDACPLCPAGRGPAPSEIPEPDYDVVVFENRFPSFSTRYDDTGFTASDSSRVMRAGTQDLHVRRPADGRCEVVAFTSDHDAKASSLSTERMRTVVEAWAHRTAELSKRPEVEHVFCFENRGAQIGVTLDHPHGQIYAYPYIPARTQAMLTRAQRHHDRTGRTLGADLLDAERAAGTRMVIEGRFWTAYVPYAARWPVEVHLVTHRDVPDLAALEPEERDELAVLYPDLLGRLDRYYPGSVGEHIPMPYVAGWQQSPVHKGRAVSRLHLQVFSILRAPDRLKFLAGSESGVGAWVNDVPPEAIAQRLREAAP